MKFKRERIQFQFTSTMLFPALSFGAWLHPRLFALQFMQIAKPPRYIMHGTSPETHVLQATGFPRAGRGEFYFYITL